MKDTIKKILLASGLSEFEVEYPLRAGYITEEGLIVWGQSLILFGEDTISSNEAKKTIKEDFEGWVKARMSFNKMLENVLQKIEQPNK